MTATAAAEKAKAEKAAHSFGRAVASVAIVAFLGGLFLMLLLGHRETKRARR